MGETVLKVRYEHIDIAKGIGIIMVIALHTNFHPEWGVSFEMPLFYMLSGIFLNTDKPSYFLNKVNSILVPAFFFYLPIVFYNVAYAFWFDIDFVKSFQFSAIPSAEWFLVSLFEVHCIAYLISRCFKSIFLIGGGFLMLTIGGFLFDYCNLHLPFFLDTSMTCSFYYLIGFLLSSSLKRLKDLHSFVLLMLCISCFVACAWVYHYFNLYAFYRNNQFTGNYLLLTMCAILGSVGVITFSGWMTHFSSPIIKAIQYCGVNSMVILCMHLYVIKVLQVCIHSEWLLCLLTILIMFPVCYLCRRFIPRICGFKPLFYKTSQL